MIHCVFTREIWFMTLQQFGLQGFTPTTDDDVAQWWVTLAAAVPKKVRKALNGLVILTARSIWLERNNRVFDRVASTAMTVCTRIRQEFELWIAAGLCGEM